MADQSLQRAKNGLSVVSGTFLTGSQQTLAVQMHVTALNAKSEPEPELVAEFDRRFSKEPPGALLWAFEAWRDASPFFPAVSDIRKLLRDWHRAARERQELDARLDEKFLLEERRKQGQVPDFAEVVKQLQEVCGKQEAEPTKHERTFRDRMEMKRISLATATMTLSDEEIRARRQKELEEIRQYREIDQQDE